MKIPLAFLAMLFFIMTPKIPSGHIVDKVLIYCPDAKSIADWGKQNTNNTLQAARKYARVHGCTVVRVLK